MASKNPKWHRDEIILALDLYFNLRDHPGQIHHNHPEIIKLSEVLNVLPIHKRFYWKGTGLFLCDRRFLIVLPATFPGRLCAPKPHGRYVAATA